MPFEPRTRLQIFREMAARLTLQSDLSDVGEGSVVGHLLGTVADEIERVENRLMAVRDAYSFERATGAELDARLRDLPAPGVVRAGQTAAAGSVLQITRTGTTGALMIPKGTLFGRTDEDGLVYATTADATIADATDTVNSVPIVALSRGAAGNAATGAINKPLTAPATVISCTNTASLSGGSEEETDESLRARARTFLSSLARCQPQALEHLAMSFVASDGSVLTHARLWEDPNSPGYSELIVAGGTQGTAAGATKTGTAPVNGQAILFFDSPAVAISSFQINATTHTVPVSDNPSWTTIEERGVIHLPDSLKLSSGDTWQVDTYNTYTGIIAELQQKIEGDPSDLDGEPGWRAAGTRVRVVPATTQTVTFQITVVAEPATDLTALRAAVKQTTVDHLANIAPGEPMFTAHLVAVLVDIDGLANVIVTTPTGDKYPQSIRHALRTTTNDITVT